MMVETRSLFGDEHITDVMWSAAQERSAAERDEARKGIDRITALLLDLLI